MQYVLQAFGEEGLSSPSWEQTYVMSFGMSLIHPTGPLRCQTMSPTLA